MTRYRRRWSDNDRNFGPFTYAYSKSYKNVGIILSSEDDDEEGTGGMFRVHVFRHTFILYIPTFLIPPYKKKVVATSWDAETIKRLGRNWYYNIVRRSFGFCISENYVHVYYGVQTHDSTTDKNWCYALPWTQWRRVRKSYYGLHGEHLHSVLNKDRISYEEESMIEDSVPRVHFEFDDYDGERIVASTHIEEREWLAGEKWCEWLSWFKKPLIHRDLSIEFSKGTGKRKGSWKGGTIGHAIRMLPGELHEAAFKRYCSEHNMTFVGPVNEVS